MLAASIDAAQGYGRVTVELSIAFAIVLLDFLLAFATVGVVHFDLLHEPYAYELTTFLRLFVAVAAWWKWRPAATSAGHFAPFCTVRLSQVPLVIGGGAVALWTVADIASRSGWSFATYFGLHDMVLLYPVVEEIVYRQILLSALLAKLHILPAIGINVAIFVLLHVGPYRSGYETNDLAVWIFVGLMTAICFVRTGSVLACIVVHSLTNGLLVAWQLQFGRI